MYQREELGPIAEGAPFYVQFAYTKNTPDLTASALQPVAPPPQTSPPPPTAAPAPQQQPAVAAKSSNDSIWIVVLPIVFAAGLAVTLLLGFGERALSAARKSDADRADDTEKGPQDGN